MRIPSSTPTEFSATARSGICCPPLSKGLRLALLILACSTFCLTTAYPRIIEKQLPSQLLFKYPICVSHKGQKNEKGGGQDKNPPCTDLSDDRSLDWSDFAPGTSWFLGLLQTCCFLRERGEGILVSWRIVFFFSI